MMVVAANRAAGQGNVVMTMAKQALVAVLAATWIVGLYHQVSLPMAVAYVAISVAMAGLILANSGMLKFAPRRKDRER